ncbi:molybdenum cofactor guanylyltransferase [Sphingomonas crusticola]|uniref:molybdenum cofactor guanylyltransferase n=1 Tax=Sphingomonas crusticola TaxID=1697973 RepID=UPI000E2523F0|nr:molybdenum cofactor guanylyltransferase [Sphingomonas crusticola]
MRLLGAILAGGRSSRFGSDKALAMLGSQALIAHAGASLQDFVAETIVCGRAQPIAGRTAIADWPATDLGPLGGLCGALRHAALHDYPAVISIGCDMPILPAGLIERLAGAGGAAYVVEAPILGYWPTRLAMSLERHLSQGGDRSIRRWAAMIGATPLEAGAPIPNVNRPEDLANLQA